MRDIRLIGADTIGIGWNFRANPVTVKLTRHDETTAAGREGVPEDEAKPGDLFTP